jgi:hypothetical protein
MTMVWPVMVLVRHIVGPDGTHPPKKPIAKTELDPENATVG